MTFQVNQKVHIDTDHSEWGRVASDGTITRVLKKFCLVQADSIRAEILVPKEDISPR